VAVTSSLVEDFFARILVAPLGKFEPEESDRRWRRNSRTAGVARKILSAAGTDEYTVVANKKAHTLSRKSAIKAIGVYGVKNDCRF
jgi:hypothetical protein